jgi:hypothetical protein
VTLTTPPWCEATVFSDSTGSGLAWDRLPEVDVEIGFVMAGDSTATLGDDVTAETVARAKMGRNERIMSSGHLVSLGRGVMRERS